MVHAGQGKRARRSQPLYLAGRARRLGGIARLPDDVVAELLEGRRVCSIWDTFTPPPLAWHMVYASSRNLSPKVRTLVEILERRFAQMRNPRQAETPGSG